MSLLSHERAKQLLQVPTTVYCAQCTSLVFSSEPVCPQCQCIRPPSGWPRIGTPQAPERVGQALGSRYLVTGFVGRGTSANIYRVLSTSLPRQYAAKMLSADTFKSSERQEWIVRTRREIDAMMRMNNPHIVSLHDAFALDDESVCLIMDYIDGQTLEQFLPEGGLDVASALNIATQIAQAIRSVHEQGIVHRDVKPENIMISRLDGEELFVTMLDFGLVTGDTRITNGFIGTPTYASPEICAGGLQVDHRSDLYSIATVLFTLLTGAPPFPGKSLFEVIHQKVTQDAPRLLEVLPEVDAALDAFVTRCLSRTPDDRPSDIGALLHELRALAEQASSTQSEALAGGISSFMRDATVLIATENPSQADRMASMLSRYSITTHVAHDAPQARAMTRSRTFDLVIMHAQLPYLRDLDVFHRLRRAGVPSIAILPPQTHPDALDVLELLGVSYLIEPMEPGVVMRAIARALPHHDGLDAYRS